MYILNNGIGDEGLRAIEAAFQESRTLKTICGATGTVLDLSGRELGVEGAKMVAIELKYNGALRSLNISSNQMATKQAGDVLGEMLKHNTALTELDVSYNAGYVTYNEEYAGHDFAAGIADGLVANRVLTSLNLANNEIGPEGVKRISAAIKANVSALRVRFGRLVPC